MKTWILKNDLSRSPQAAIRTYAYSIKKEQNAKNNMAIKAPPYLLISRIKSQIKSLLKLLEQRINICVENN